jgi:hypothetical protein
MRVTGSSNSERVLASAPSVRRPDEGVNAWLVELGALVRSAEARAQLEREQGHRLRAWASRRAGSRSRRLIVQHALATSATPAEGPPPVEDVFEDVELEIELEPEREAETKPQPILSAPAGLEEPDGVDVRELFSPLLSRIGAYTGPSSGAPR